MKKPATTLIKDAYRRAVADDRLSTMDAALAMSEQLNPADPYAPDPFFVALGHEDPADLSVSDITLRIRESWLKLTDAIPELASSRATPKEISAAGSTVVFKLKTRMHPMAFQSSFYLAIPKEESPKLLFALPVGSGRNRSEIARLIDVPDTAHLGMVLSQFTRLFEDPAYASPVELPDVANTKPIPRSVASIAMAGARSFQRRSKQPQSRLLERAFGSVFRD